MSAPRWDDMEDWDPHELLDAYGELRDQFKDEPGYTELERKYLRVREEILRRCATRGGNA